MTFYFNGWADRDSVRPRRSLRIRWKLLVGTWVTSTCVFGQPAVDLLASADRLANEENWFAAAPLYARAEVEFRRGGDSRNEVYAKLGRLRRDAEAGAYRSVRDQVNKVLSDPLVDGAPALKFRALALLGTIDLNLDTEAARRDWQNLLAIATTAKDAKWQNRARGELGLVAGATGDIRSAAIALLQAIPTAEKLGDIPAIIHFSIWLANGMSVNGMGDRALATIDRANEVARKAGYQEVPIQLRLAKIRASNLLPEPERDTRREETKKLIAATLTQARKTGILGAQSELLQHASQVAANENDFAKAASDLKQSIDIARSANLPRLEAGALLRAAGLYRMMGQPKLAAEAVARGIAVVQGVEEGYDLPLFIAEQAEVQADLGQLTAADQSYARATSLIEGLLVNAPSSRVKSSMIGTMSNIYLGHFRLAWDKSHDARKAFRIIESARGRALLDSIRLSSHSAPTAAQSNVEREVSRIQRELLHSRLNSVQTQRVLAQLDAAYDRLSPVEYARDRKQMSLVGRPPVALPILQRQLSPTEAIIEYVLDVKDSHAIRITSSGVTIHRLPERAAIDRMVKAYLDAIQSKKPSTETAQALYASLIAPIATGDKSALIIVPDGSLHLVPFASLVDPSSSYLGQTLTLSVAPSATVYSALKATPQEPRATKPFLGVAYAAMQSGGATSSTQARTLTSDMKPLQFAREEIVEAAQKLGSGSVTLTGSLATESELKSQPLREFKVVHIAAHGVGNELEPDRSALILEPGNDIEDGMWQAREIRQSRISAEIVVLSACETGRGRLQGQEGVMNLARAFLTAGAKSVVASLWAVDDRSTATLMGYFYDHLAKGVQVRESLRLAQLDFVRDYGDKAQPYLWAGFEVIGDGTRRIGSSPNKADARAAHTGLR